MSFLNRFRAKKERTSNSIEIVDERRQDVTDNVEARYLTPEEIAEYSPASPTGWNKVFPNIVQRITGLGRKPEGSGMGYVMSPYLQVYSLTYGLNPIVDLPKYRQLLRSITKDTNIIAFNDSDMHMQDIENFSKFEGMKFDGNDEIIYPRQDIFVPALDASNKVANLAKVKAIMRHKYNGDMYKITTSRGRTIKVTGNHSVFVWEAPFYGQKWARLERGNIALKEARNITTKDYLLTSTTLPVIEKDMESMDIVLTDRRFTKNKEKQTKIITVKITDDLLWILGLFLAEGSIFYKRQGKNGDKYRTTFYTENKYLDRVAKILDDMEIKYYRQEYGEYKNEKFGKDFPYCFPYSMSNIKVGSPIIYKLVKDSHHDIPGWILQLPVKRLKHFLHGYWCGDGSHNVILKRERKYNNRKNKYIIGETFSAKTSKRNVAEKLLFLLMRFGIVSSIRLNKDGCYMITADGLENLDIEHWDNIKQRLLGHKVNNLLPLRVKKVEKLPNNNEDVYDFSVEGYESFIAGDGIYAHNSEPDIRQAIDMQSYLIGARPLRIEYEHKESRDFIEDMCDRIDLNHNLIPFMTDGLAYGTGYMEIGWNDKREVEEVGELPKEATEPLLAVKEEDFKGLDVNYAYTMNELKNKMVKAQSEGKLFNNNGKQFVANKVVRRVKPKKKKETNGGLDILGLKPLDPLYVRPRVDAWGNFYGFLQWLDFPPMLIDNDCMMHYRHNFKSWAYESNFGSSILQPLVRNNDMLRQFENDCLIWMHYRAVPPLVVKGGTSDHPYDVDRMKDLMARIQKRTAATTIFVKGDVEIQELKGAAAELQVEWWLNHILRQRRAALGVPPHLLGQPAEVSATASEVMLADFVSRMEIYREQMSDIIVNHMFVPLIKGRWGEEVIKKYGEPRIVWEPILQEDRNTRLARVMKMVPARIYTINEARRECGLKSLDGAEYDKPVPVQTKTPFGGGQAAQSRGVRVNSPSFRPMAKIMNDIGRDELTNNLSGIIAETRIDIGAGDMLIKDIKAKAEAKASHIINAWKDEYESEMNKTELLGSFMLIIDKLVGIRNE